MPKAVKKTKQHPEPVYTGQETVEALFDGYSLGPEDFHGIKQLLKQLFLVAPIDLTELTDLLIAQRRRVGTVLKQVYSDSDEEDELEMDNYAEIFAITSVLGLTHHIESECVRQLLDVLNDIIKKHADSSNLPKIKQILEQTVRGGLKLGLLINERFINLPSQVANQMLGALQTELEKAKEMEACYDFDYFVMICKCTKPKGDKHADLTFTNEEEQIAWQQADCRFSYRVTDDNTDTGLTGEWDSEDAEVIPYRSVLFFEKSKLPTIVNAIRVFVQA